MRNNIPEILNSRKTRDIALIGIIMLLGGLCFVLGRLSMTSDTHVPVALCARSLDNTVPHSKQTNETVTGETYVASKNSDVYHFPWCSGAKRISDANRITFTSKKEAEQAGYRPAANCKGL